MGYRTVKWSILACLVVYMQLAAISMDIQVEEPIQFGARLRNYDRGSSLPQVRETPAQTYRAMVQHGEPYFSKLKDVQFHSPPLQDENKFHIKPHSEVYEKTAPKNAKPATSFADPNPVLKPKSILHHKNDPKSGTLDTASKKNLDRSQNLQFNKIEPFWPFSNISSVHFSNSFGTFKDQTSGFPFDSLPERFKDTTFFFSHIGPNSFEYRAQFHHGHDEFKQTKFFKPFVNEFPDFPKMTFPPFPSFPEAQDIFQNKPNLPDFPNLSHIQFPTIAPPIKRILHPTIEQRVPDKNNFGGPFKPYDIVLGDISTKYPKIFRFNEERINIEDFEREKKLQMKLNGINNNIATQENVQRNHLLILHGGIFTVKEPPLYHRKVFRKRRQRLRNGGRINNS